jgi:hypothetical protein
MAAQTLDCGGGITVSDSTGDVIGCERAQVKGLNLSLTPISNPDTRLDMLHVEWASGACVSNTRINVTHATGYLEPIPYVIAIDEDYQPLCVGGPVARAVDLTLKVAVPARSSLRALRSRRKRR